MKSPTHYLGKALMYGVIGLAVFAKAAPTSASASGASLNLEDVRRAMGSPVVYQPRPFFPYRYSIDDTYYWLLDHWKECREPSDKPYMRNLARGLSVKLSTFAKGHDHVRKVCPGVLNDANYTIVGNLSNCTDETLSRHHSTEDDPFRGAQVIDLFLWTDGQIPLGLNDYLSQKKLNEMKIESKMIQFLDYCQVKFIWTELPWKESPLEELLRSLPRYLTETPPRRTDSLRAANAHDMHRSSQPVPRSVGDAHHNGISAYVLEGEGPHPERLAAGASSEN